MKTIVKITIVLILLASHSSCGGGNHGKAIVDFNPLENIITRWIDRNYYPEAGIAVADKNRIIYEACYGDYSCETVVTVTAA